MTKKETRQNQDGSFFGQNGGFTQQKNEVEQKQGRVIQSFSGLPIQLTAQGKMISCPDDTSGEASEAPWLVLRALNLSENQGSQEVAIAETLKQAPLIWAVATSNYLDSRNIAREALEILTNDCQQWRMVGVDVTVKGLSIQVISCDNDQEMRSGTLGIELAADAVLMWEFMIAGKTRIRLADLLAGEAIMMPSRTMICVFSHNEALGREVTVALKDELGLHFQTEYPESAFSFCRNKLIS